MAEKHVENPLVIGGLVSLLGPGYGIWQSIGRRRAFLNPMVIGAWCPGWGLATVTGGLVSLLGACSCVGTLSSHRRTCFEFHDHGWLGVLVNFWGLATVIWGLVSLLGPSYCIGSVRSHPKTFFNPMVLGGLVSLMGPSYCIGSV